ncbi:suppressor of mec-8 and unc-52 protein-like protein 2 [Iris pallida]|uniref:Suppressor of mec-8 and unc-52 protein-like protein 2 n=1 Tax=Iris pallida TaxID=29817 RepID=A0AAX6F3J4_IRIPA|nr:suppressor of mec-8 and unc-52 protein-like protein 2 [Iris pallida]
MLCFTRLEVKLARSRCWRLEGWDTKELVNSLCGPNHTSNLRSIDIDTQSLVSSIRKCSTKYATFEGWRICF